MKKTVKSALIVSALVAAGAVMAHGGMGGDGMHHGMMGHGAHMGHGMHMGMHHQPVDVAKLLNLDATRAAQVNTILADARAQRKAMWEAHKGAAHDDASRAAFRAQMKSLRETTRTKLAAVLTTEELKTLRDSMPHRGMHGHKHS